MIAFDERINKEICHYSGSIKSIKQLKSAQCNSVYLVDAQNGKYVMKITSGNRRNKELKIEAEMMRFLENKLDIPKVFSYGVSEEISYLLMEYVEGETLENLFRAESEKTCLVYELGRTLRKIHGTRLNETYSYKDLISRSLVEAELNMQNNMLDPEEFLIDGIYTEPSKLLNHLMVQKIEASDVCLLHGDFRPKNIIYNGSNVVIDWGFSRAGDSYYDLAIILYYFDPQEQSVFLDGYGIKSLDCERLKYFDNLSKFINV